MFGGATTSSRGALRQSVRDVLVLDGKLETLGAAAVAIGGRLEALDSEVSSAQRAAQRFFNELRLCFGSLRRCCICVVRARHHRLARLECLHGA